jgi:hypothetical protein
MPLLKPNSRHCEERSEAIFSLKIKHLEIAASLALLYALWVFRPCGSRKDRLK